MKKYLQLVLIVAAVSSSQAFAKEFCLGRVARVAITESGAVVTDESGATLKIDGKTKLDQLGITLASSAIDKQARLCYEMALWGFKGDVSPYLSGYSLQKF